MRCVIGSRSADIPEPLGQLAGLFCVEKYANAAQSGAIDAMNAAGWEARWNSGAGIALGSGGRVHASDVHHNGQIGIVGEGRNIQIDGNRIWGNNTRGFDFTWEGGGVKLVAAMASQCETTKPTTT